MRTMMTTRSLVTAFSTLLAGFATVGCMEQGMDPLDPAGTTAGSTAGQTTPTPTPAPTPTPTPVPPPAAKTPTLFVANNGVSGVLSFANPATANGNIAPTTNLLGGQTQLKTPQGIFVNSLGTLITTNFDAPFAINFHDQAVRANGNLSPDRNITGAASGLLTPNGLAWEAGSDTLFCLNRGAAGVPGFVVTYADASDSATRGNLAPLTKITSTDIGTPSSMSLSSAGDLYVLNLDKRTVAVFADAAGVNGPKAADRVISSPVFAAPGRLGDVKINALDQMFVVIAGDRVAVFNGASGLNGSVMPDSVLRVTGASDLANIAVDSRGVGYLSDFGLNAIYAFDSIATRNGTFAPDRTIRGGSTQLVTPTGLFIDE